MWKAWTPLLKPSLRWSGKERIVSLFKKELPKYSYVVRSKWKKLVSSIRTIFKWHRDDTINLNSKYLRMAQVSNKRFLPWITNAFQNINGVCCVHTWLLLFLRIETQREEVKHIRNISTFSGILFLDGENRTIFEYTYNDTMPPGEYMILDCSHRPTFPKTVQAYTQAVSVLDITSF